MNLAHQFCDFCGHVIKRGEKHASMTVPKDCVPVVDRTQLPKKAKAEPLDPYQVFFSVRMVYGESSDDQQYDICLGCARSFLAARFSALKRAEAFIKAHGSMLTSAGAGVLGDDED